MTKLEVHCTRCGAHKLTHEAPRGAGELEELLWVERRRREALQGDMTFCACGAEMAYQVASVCPETPAGIRPKDVTRPIVHEVEVVSAGTLVIRGKFLAGAILELEGVELALQEECANRVTLPGHLVSKGEGRVRIRVRNEHGHRGDEATADIDLGQLGVVTKSLAS